MSCPSFCTTSNCDLPYGKHAFTFGIASAALPTRGHAAAAINAKEQRWTRDMDAYKRLRRDGLQPPQIDGSHHLEAAAEVPEHVAMGDAAWLVDPDSGEHRLTKPEAFKAFEETFERKATSPAVEES